MPVNPRRDYDKFPDQDYTHRPAAGAAGKADRLANLTITAHYYKLNELIRRTNKVIHQASIAGHANIRYIPLYRFDGATYNLFPQDRGQINQLTSKYKIFTIL